MAERMVPWASVPPELAFVLARDACPDLEVKARAMVAGGQGKVAGERLLFGIAQLREIARLFAEAQAEARRVDGSASQAGVGRSEVPIAQVGARSERHLLLGGDGLTTQEVAVELGICPRQVINLIEEGKLTATFTKGRHLVTEESLAQEHKRRSSR